MSIACVESSRSIRSGFGRMEMIIVLVIVVAIAAIGYPAARGAVQSVKQGRAITDLRTVEREIMNYRLQTGRLPESLSELGIEDLLDPWKRPYRYDNIDGHDDSTASARLDYFHLPINGDYDLYCEGGDGNSAPPLASRQGRDDIVRGNDGAFIGAACRF